MAALTEVERAAVAAELELRKCERDCSYFADRYVRLLDPGPPPKELEFHLWPEQKAVLRDMVTCPRICILKARQLGLTWLALTYAIWRMLWMPGYRVVCFSLAEKEAKDLLDRVTFILARLPKWMCREEVKGDKSWKLFAPAGPTWRATTEAVYITHPSKLTSIMQAFPSTTSAGRSYTANLVLLDEFANVRWPGKIWSSALPTVSKAGGFGQVFVISTMELGTFYEGVCREAMDGLNGFKFIFLPWTVDPARTSEWREARKKEDPENHLREYPISVEEAMSMGSSTFFPTFSRAIHVVDPFPVPDWWPRWLGNDPGYSETFAWLWFTSDPDGNVYVYREWCAEKGSGKLAYHSQAAQVREISRVYDHDGQIVREEFFEMLATGHDVGTVHPETLQSIEDYYAQGFGGGDPGNCAIPIISAPADRKRRGAIMREYLEPWDDENFNPPRKTAKLKIFNTCHRLIAALPRAKKDENMPEAYAEFNEVHVLDALGYGLVVWHPDGGEEPGEPPPPIKKHKDSVAKGAFGDRKRALIA